MYRFDFDSGQVYTESVIKAPRKRRPMLTVRPTYVSPPEGGAQSLNDIALRKILCNLDSLDEGCLGATPFQLQQVIWKAIRRHHLDSLQIWKMFASTGAQERTFIYRWTPEVHDISFRGALSHATSMTNAWLTNLTIENTFVHASELADVPQLVNLRVFNLVGGSKHPEILTDSIFRSWATAAAEHGAFSHLQMIFVRSQRKVTIRSVERLANFPALDTFCVYDCGFSNSKAVYKPAKQLGWHRNSKSGRWATYIDRDFRTRRLKWIDQIENYVIYRRGATPRSMGNSPVLDVSLGCRDGGAVHLEPHFLQEAGKPLLNCFERDVLRERGRAESQNNGRKLPDCSSPPSKKPKIRQEKTIALDDLISHL